MIKSYQITANDKKETLIKIKMNGNVSNYEYQWDDGYKKKDRKDFSFGMKLRVFDKINKTTKLYSFGCN